MAKNETRMGLLLSTPLSMQQAGVRENLTALRKTVPDIDERLDTAHAVSATKEVVVGEVVAVNFPANDRTFGDAATAFAEIICEYTSEQDAPVTVTEKDVRKWVNDHLRRVEAIAEKAKLIGSPSGERRQNEKVGKILSAKTKDFGEEEWGELAALMRVSAEEAKSILGA